MPNDLKSSSLSHNSLETIYEDAEATFEYAFYQRGLSEKIHDDYAYLERVSEAKKYISHYFTWTQAWHDFSHEIKGSFKRGWNVLRHRSLSEDADVNLDNFKKLNEAMQLVMEYTLLLRFREKFPTWNDRERMLLSKFILHQPALIETIVHLEEELVKLIAINPHFGVEGNIIKLFSAEEYSSSELLPAPDTGWSLKKFLFFGALMLSPYSQSGIRETQAAFRDKRYSKSIKSGDTQPIDSLSSWFLSFLSPSEENSGPDNLYSSQSNFSLSHLASRINGFFSKNLNAIYNYRPPSLFFERYAMGDEQPAAIPLEENTLNDEEVMGDNEPVSPEIKQLNQTNSELADIFNNIPEYPRPRYASDSPNAAVLLSNDEDKYIKKIENYWRDINDRAMMQANNKTSFKHHMGDNLRSLLNAAKSTEVLSKEEYDVFYKAFKFPNKSTREARTKSAAPHIYSISVSFERDRSVYFDLPGVFFIKENEINFPKQENFAQRQESTEREDMVLLVVPGENIAKFSSVSEMEKFLRPRLRTLTDFENVRYETVWFPNGFDGASGNMRYSEIHDLSTFIPQSILDHIKARIDFLTGLLQMEYNARAPTAENVQLRMNQIKGWVKNRFDMSFDIKNLQMQQQEFEEKNRKLTQLKERVKKEKLPWLNGLSIENQQSYFEDKDNYLFARDNYLLEESPEVTKLEYATEIVDDYLITNYDFYKSAQEIFVNVSLPTLAHVREKLHQTLSLAQMVSLGLRGVEPGLDYEIKPVEGEKPAMTDAELRNTLNIMHSQISYHQDIIKPHLNKPELKRAGIDLRDARLQLSAKIALLQRHLSKDAYDAIQSSRRAVSTTSGTNVNTVKVDFYINDHYYDSFVFNGALLFRLNTNNIKSYRRVLYLPTKSLKERNFFEFNDDGTLNAMMLRWIKENTKENRSMIELMNLLERDSFDKISTAVRSASKASLVVRQNLIRDEDIPYDDVISYQEDVNISNLNYFMRSPAETLSNEMQSDNLRNLKFKANVQNEFISKNVTLSYKDFTLNAIDNLLAHPDGVEIKTQLDDIMVNFVNGEEKSLMDVVMYHKKEAVNMYNVTFTYSDGEGVEWLNNKSEIAPPSNDVLLNKLFIDSAIPKNMPYNYWGLRIGLLMQTHYNDYVSTFNAKTRSTAGRNRVKRDEWIDEAMYSRILYDAEEAVITDALSASQKTHLLNQLILLRAKITKRNVRVYELSLTEVSSRSALVFDLAPHNSQPDYFLYTPAAKDGVKFRPFTLASLKRRSTQDAILSHTPLSGADSLERAFINLREGNFPDPTGFNKVDSLSEIFWLDKQRFFSDLDTMNLNPKPYRTIKINYFAMLGFDPADAVVPLFMGLLKPLRFLKNLNYNKKLERFGKSTHQSKSVQKVKNKKSFLQEEPVALSRKPNGLKKYNGQIPLLQDTFVVESPAGSANGYRYYIKEKSRYYQVVLDSENNTLRVVNPRNPNSQYKRPIVKDRRGEWIYNKNTNKLRGGQLPEFEDSAKNYRLAGEAKNAMDDYLDSTNAPDNPTLSARDRIAKMESEDRDLKILEQAAKDQNSKLTDNTEKFQSRLTHGIDIDEESFRKTFKSASTSLDSDVSILDNVFKESRGLVIGEIHTDTSSVKFLKDNMASLQRNNVKKIYLEGVLGDYLQSDLDNFFNTNYMSPRLKNALDNMDEAQGVKGSGYGKYDLVKAAREHGIEVVGMETPGATSGYAGEMAKKTRLRNYNYYASLLISNDQAENGASNWIAVVGNRHAANTGREIGLAERTGALSAVLYNNNGNRKVQFDEWYKMRKVIKMTFPNILIGL